MARSRYENCFYYFRGPGVREQALLNVLEHSGPGLTRSFLNTVVGIAVPLDQLPVQYFLQNGPGTPADNRLLLGLSNTGQIEPASWVGRDAGSRVDGAIHVPDRFTVLIEPNLCHSSSDSSLSTSN